ncbi:MAG TPA: S8 family serine peptidase [Candidatus Caccocola faecipullorum]|nr:S8 family serine peptidase [Candidatus Caccocola faecipullorum]
MKLKIFIAALVLALSSFALPARAEETPRYVEGEAIVVMRGGSSVPAAARARNAAQDGGGPAGGFVIQYFNPIKGRETPANAAARTVPAQSETLAVAHLRAPNGLTTEEFIEKLRAEPDVVSAMPNYIMHTQAVTPNDTEWSRQWGPAAIHAPGLWKQGTGSDEVVVAVIDTGVIYDHPDIAPNMYTFDEETAKAIIAEDPDMLTGEVPLAGSHGAWFHTSISAIFGNEIFDGVPVGPLPTMQGDEDEQGYIDSGKAEEMSRIGDVTGHGAHVAGIIGAVGNNNCGIAGINWNVHILAVNVFSYSILGGNGAETSDIIRGIDFVIAAKRAGVNIRAANLSLGDWFSPSKMEGSPYDYKIKELSEAGIVVCMAAGNNGQDIDDSAKFPGQRFYPAAFRYENTIAVGALMQNADGSILPDTPDNGGLGYSDYSASGKWVDVFAPGTAIYSTCRTKKLLAQETFDASGYISIDGTSMAAPHVTGTAALLASMFPEKSATEIKQLILDGANGSIAKEGYSAHGALDAYEAWNGYAEAVEPEQPSETPENVTPVYAQIATDGTALGKIFDKDELREVDNMFYLDAGITKSAVKNIRADKTVSGISLFPVFTAESDELKQNSLGAVAFAVSGEAFGDGSTLADVAVCKVFPDGTALEYKEAGASPADGTFTVTEADGATLSGHFDAEKKYIITLYIADNGDYDLDKTGGIITDPTAIVTLKTPEPQPAPTASNSGGGGCSAAHSAAAIFALAALPFVLRKKK